MRFLLVIIIILSFQSLTKAEDIRDFEIENMSLGDSLLKYFSKKEIEDNRSGAQYPNKEFILYYFKGLSKFEHYEAVTVAVKTNDKDYIIYDLGGSIYFKDNFQDCLSMMKKVDYELNQMFTKAKNSSGKNSHAYDKSGKTIQHYSIYELETGDNSQIVCLNWSDKLEKNGHIDELNLTIGFKEYGDFVRYRAYD
mgnify:CR=1 FL=1|tara:strand:+ start:1687 stop:2271 length:585 start_codon:yes stop_codon:yes gene_type:complete